jgi:hypothetical protein
LAGSRDNSTFCADYHQQYLAKNPDGYCPNHSCRIPYKSAVLYAGEKVEQLILLGVHLDANGLPTSSAVFRRKTRDVFGVEVYLKSPSVLHVE